MEELLELLSYLLFQIAPRLARQRHVRRLTDPTGRRLVLVGTAHSLHFRSQGYPVWSLAALIRGIHPDMVMVEMLPAAIQGGHLGEGPAEMAFCAHVARALNIRLDGIDDWSRPNRTREDRIADNITAALAPARTALAFVGYSHLWELLPRLRRRGMADEPISRKELAGWFGSEADRTWPAGLARAYRTAAARALAGETPYGPVWARERAGLAKRIDGG